MPVFIVKCPGCQTKYKISTEKIKPGSKVKCPKCKTVFLFKVPEKFLRPSQPVSQPRTAPVKEKESPKVKEAAPTQPEQRVIPKALEVPPDIPPEERKIHERAIRLAKILAKDIINYYKDRWERALRQGNLREEFKKEIMESWKYYCEKIPKEIRDKTNYFQEAFNQIVGKGQKIL